MNTVTFEIEIEDNADNSDAGVLRGTLDPEIVSVLEAENLPDYLFSVARKLLFTSLAGQEFLRQEGTILFRNLKDAGTVEEWAEHGITFAASPQIWKTVEASHYSISEDDLDDAIAEGAATDLMDEE